MHDYTGRRFYGVVRKCIFILLVVYMLKKRFNTIGGVSAHPRYEQTSISIGRQDVIIGPLHHQNKFRTSNACARMMIGIRELMLLL